MHLHKMTNYLIAVMEFSFPYGTFKWIHSFAWVTLFYLVIHLSKVKMADNAVYTILYLSLCYYDQIQQVNLLKKQISCKMPPK